MAIILPHLLCNTISSILCPPSFGHISWSLSKYPQYCCFIILSSTLQSVCLELQHKKCVRVEHLDEVVDSTECSWDVCLYIQIIFCRDYKYSPLTLYHAKCLLNHIAKSGMMEVEQFFLVVWPIVKM